MNEHERVKKMIQEGTINSEQGEMLIRALDEAQARRERIFSQVNEQKNKREKKAWGFLNAWFVIMAAAVILFALSGARETFGRDSVKALDNMRHAAEYIQAGNYEGALGECDKAIKNAPFLRHFGFSWWFNN